MLRLCFFILWMLMGIHSTWAATLNCSGSTSVGGTFKLPHLNITAPRNNDTYTLLYTAQNVKMGSVLIQAICTGGVYNFSYAITNTLPGTVHSYNGYTIYPTSVKGIGVSINSAVSSTSASVPIWPGSLAVRKSSDIANGNGQVDTYVTLRLWKTPEFSGSTSAIDVTGPTLIEVIQPVNTGDTFSSCPAGSVALEGDNRTCELLTRDLVMTGSLHSGTCDIMMANHVIRLGNHDGARGNNSPWVDASFQVTCPQAWGYGGKVTNSTNPYDANNGTKTANTTLNQTVKIEILPRTPVVPEIAGAFELDPGGASGFGIQLAWGRPSSQQSTPGNPVALGTRIAASSLNSNFSSGPYAVGTYALPIGADGTIPMSARYVRTSGAISGGPATGKVEVMVSYE